MSTDGSDISASVIKDTTESGSSDAEHLNNSEKGSEQTKSNISTGIAGSVKDQLSGNNGQEDSEASKLDHSVHNDGLSDVSVSHGHVNTIDQQTDASNVLEEKHTQGK